MKGFLVAALQSALDLGIATCDDVVKHVTPDVLAMHLPRPLWARLLTACMGAPRVDAQLVVETIGVPNLCEHVPTPIMWSVLEEIGARSLGGDFVPRPVAESPLSSLSSSISAPLAQGTQPLVERRPLSITPPPEVIAPPPPVTATQPTPTIAMGPDIPAPSGIDQLFSSDVPIEDRPTGPGRARTPTQQRFRQSSTGIGRLAANRDKVEPARRPQASASAPSQFSDDTRAGRRAPTESEYEVLTDVGGRPNDDWKAALAVEDEQLVDWSGSEETVSGDVDRVPVPPGSDDRRRR